MRRRNVIMPVADSCPDERGYNTRRLFTARNAHVRYAKPRWPFGRKLVGHLH
jgi:hypothetical protein